MGTGYSENELKKIVEEIAKTGDRKKLQEIGKSADPDEVFLTIIPIGVANEPTSQERLKGTTGVLTFEIDDMKYFLKVDGGKVSTGKGEPPQKPDAQIKTDMATFRKLMSQELEPTIAFMQGLLKVSGDMGLVFKLYQVLLGWLKG